LSRVRQRSNLTTLIVALVTLAADQMSKALVVSRLAYGERIDLLPFLALERTSNRGVAFGLASDVSPAVLVVLAVAISAVILTVGSRLSWRFAPVATGLILGGALGNLYDRVAQGYVIDFIELPNWPTFNLADVAITVGVGLLLVGLVKNRER